MDNFNICSQISSGDSKDHQLCLTIILRRSGTEILVIWDNQRALLPLVSVARQQRIAEQVNQAVRDYLGLSAYSLFTLKIPESSVAEPGLVQVMECLAPEDYTPLRGAWVSAGPLNSESFRSGEEAAIVTTALERINAARNDDMHAPFGILGWIKELLHWAQEQVLPLGLRLTGQFRQLDSRPDSALLRMETDADGLWFKAVGNLNRREYAITLLLSRLFPRFLPPLVAAHAEWHGWLTREFVASALNISAEPSLWKHAARNLAELQTESLGHIEDCLAAGCRDLRCQSLLEQVVPFLEVMVELMREQRTVPPTPLRKSEVFRLAAPIKEAICVLSEFEIPDALGHLDLNPGNVLSSGERCIFLDWADAYVGPPFLTFEYLRLCARQACNNPAMDSELVKAYSERWSAQVAPEKILNAFQVSPLVAVFAYASGTGLWRNLAQIHECGVAGYLRSLTRRIEKEARVLAEGRRIPASFQSTEWRI